MKPNLTHECVLGLLKLSFNVNECKPCQVRVAGRGHHEERFAGAFQPQHGHVQRASTQVVHHHESLAVILGVAAQVEFEGNV